MTGYTAAELAADCIACGRLLNLPSEVELGLEYAAMAGATTHVVNPEPKPRRPRRARKPTLARAIAEARKAGATLAGAMLTADGVSLQFGEPADNKPTNELDEWLAKHAH